MLRNLSHRQYTSIGKGLLLVAAAALTLLLASRTFSYLFHSVSNVPFADQWVMLQEVEELRSGQTGWTYLWSPYWGHRPVLLRLLILASVRYLRYSMLPFVITNVAAQAGMLLGMVILFQQLFRYSRRLFWLSTIACIHLLFSSLQMDIFIVGSAINYTIGYASAVSAIVLLGADVNPRLKFNARFGLALLLGIISTVSIAIGPFIWPILILEAWLVRVRLKQLVILTAVAALIMVPYSIGYTRPDMGMGIAGTIRHPIQAICVTAFVLGGPISIYDPWFGVIAGAIGMICASGIVIYFWRTRSAAPPALPLMAIVLFLLGSAVSFAVGRLTPDVLDGHSGQPVSRYLEPVFVFWAALFPVALTGWNTGRLGRLAAVLVSVIIAIFTFGTWNWQWRMPTEWASISQDHDAVASGFLLGVSDREYMSRIIPDDEIRRRMVDYMRQQRLSVFAERRADWIGQNIKAIAQAEESANCRARTDFVQLGDNQLAFRISGTLTTEEGVPRHLLDILMTDDTGVVKGLARTLPVKSEHSSAADFFGYVQGISAQNVRLFVLFQDKISECSR